MILLFLSCFSTIFRGQYSRNLVIRLKMRQKPYIMFGGGGNNRFPCIYLRLSVTFDPKQSRNHQKTSKSTLKIVITNHSLDYFWVIQTLWKWVENEFLRFFFLFFSLKRCFSGVFSRFWMFLAILKFCSFFFFFFHENVKCANFLSRKLILDLKPSNPFTITSD